VLRKAAYLFLSHCRRWFAWSKRSDSDSKALQVLMLVAQMRSCAATVQNKCLAPDVCYSGSGLRTVQAKYQIDTRWFVLNTTARMPCKLVHLQIIPGRLLYQTYQRLTPWFMTESDLWQPEHERIAREKSPFSRSSCLIWIEIGGADDFSLRSRAESVREMDYPAGRDRSLK
jgi:hypothetical protein